MNAVVRLGRWQSGKPVEARFVLEQTRCAEDLAKLLPLDLRLTDYAGTELIADLPRKLSTEGAPAAYRPRRGDLCYYAPWGNLALFYKDHGSAVGLVLLGRAEKAEEPLAMSLPAAAWLELLPPNPRATA